ncbi:hypothetical protein Fot_35383 [Forsythia ovata]|uniref:Uncharacterized protein n=1 Tax=Forsythia ovata TaxID=205694 RepID=A0ABD1SLE0_9LAMI
MALGIRHTRQDLLAIANCDGEPSRSILQSIVPFENWIESMRGQETMRHVNWWLLGCLVLDRTSKMCVATYLVPAVVTVHALQTSAVRSDPLSTRAKAHSLQLVLSWDRRLIE